jgi:hypothetical protein
MSTCLSIQVLGVARGGRFAPCPLQPCSYFNSDRVAVGSKEWSHPALVVHDSTVSPRHALIVKEGERWVVKDMDSDNGLRAVSLIDGAEIVTERQSSRIEFQDEISCCVGAVVLRLKAFIQ